MPNEPQPQGACELQGRQIEPPSLPALVSPIDTRRWVLADNTFWHAGGTFYVNVNFRRQDVEGGPGHV
jgi:hypothetical protein